MVNLFSIDSTFQVERTAVSTAVILLSFSNVNSYIVPQDGQRLKEKIKHNVDILLQVPNTYPIRNAYLDEYKKMPPQKFLR